MAECKCDQCKLEGLFRRRLVKAWSDLNEEGLEPARVLRVVAEYAGGVMAIMQDVEGSSEGDVRALHYSRLEIGYAEALKNLGMRPSVIATVAPRGRA